MRSSRKRKAEVAAQRRTLEFHEAAGDLAQKRYAYPEALRYYEEALRSPALRPQDDVRLSQKHASALFFGREPQNARMWFERALEGIRKGGITPENADAAGTLLLRLSRQGWLDAATVSALPLISEAIQLGTVARREGFFARANLAMAHYLILLGRHQAAEPFFERAGNVVETDSPEMRAISFAQRGILYAAQGNREAAYAAFDAGVEAAKQLPDGYQVTSLWNDYGTWAMALGDIKTSQMCLEHALLVARERHIAWRIADCSLRYAALLFELEQYDRAHDLLLDALTYDIETPSVVIFASLAGIRLAGALGDSALMHRCRHQQGIAYAFQSGEVSRIGPIVSAAVRMHVAAGEHKVAQELLSRGLAAVLNADHAWDLLVDVALLGNDAEQSTARALIAARAALPNNDVAVACLDLFDAIAAKRRGEIASQRRLAARSAKRFAKLGWPAQQRLAQSYSGEARQQPTSAKSFRTMLGDISSLTKREEEVAELVLKGLTNRAIARELWISEHTVESHMTSIMNRLGIRSRHQLVDLMQP